KILSQYTHAYNKEEKLLVPDDFIRQEEAGLVDTVVDLISEKYELHNWKSRKIFLPEKDAFVQTYATECVLRFKEKKIGKLIREIQELIRPDDPERDARIQTLSNLTILKAKINKALNRVV